MARDFESTSAQFLTVDSAPVTAVPLTIACWFRPESVTDARLVTIVDKDVDTEAFSVEAWSDTNLYASTSAGGGIGSAVASGPWSVAAWTHATAVFGAADSRTIYRDGGNSGTNTDSFAPSGLDRVAVATWGGSVTTSYFDGRIAEIGIWNVALTEDEAASLADGASPMLVRPDALVAYWPLIGRASPEIDLIGGANLTVTGAVVADHPRIMYPGSRQRGRRFQVGAPPPQPNVWKPERRVSRPYPYHPGQVR